MKTTITLYYLGPPLLRVALAFFLCLGLASLGWGQTTQTYTANGNFSVPAGVTKVTVQAWGGGGAGGYASGGLFSGDQAAGGGGGAYARSILEVSGTYTITVGEGGSGTSNASPGTSSIFGSNLVVAVGGAGVANNNNTGGQGGQATSCIGHDKFNGGNGGNVASNNSGGGGGGAGNAADGGNASGTTAGTGGSQFGGDGGVGRTSNSSGAVGNTLGGGGGGGKAGAWGSNNGGAGARGEVRVSYYLLTSVTTTSFVCANNPATVTINATAVNLPVGTYTVTYNISAPNAQTGLTASMVVTTAGIGTFTTPVLANGGNTNITVTQLQSGIYAGGIGANNTASIFVNEMPQGSLAGNTICSHGGTGQFTFTASAGAGPFTLRINGVDYSNVVSGVAFNANPNPGITTNYALQRITGSNGCVRDGGFTVGTATITVNPTPQGSLTANGPFCESGTGQLTFTASFGASPYTVVYYDGTANRTANGVVSGTPFDAFTNPVTSTTTYTLVSVTGSNACTRTSGFSGGPATITIRPLPTFTYTKTDLSCFEEAMGEIIINAAGGSGSGYEYQYRYREDANASWGGWSGWIDLATDFDELPAGLYEIQLRDSNGCIQTQNQVIP